MTSPRLTLLALLTLTAACGADTDTTAGTTDTSAESTAGEPNTSALTTTGDPTVTPTTAGDTTESGTTTQGTTTTATPSTTDVSSTTDQTSTGCAGDCGVVVVEGPTSLCDENDPNMVPPTLMAVAGGPGKIDVTETGYETSCCLELDPSAKIDGMTINIDYTEVGDPCDCICYYTINYTLSGVTSGTWSVVSGGQSVDVDVP